MEAGGQSVAELIAVAAIHRPVDDNARPEGSAKTQSSSSPSGRALEKVPEHSPLLPLASEVPVFAGAPGWPARKLAPCPIRGQSQPPTREDPPMYRFALALAAVAMVATPSVGANRCRAPNGKFIKCPPPKAATTATKKCRAANGKFAKCGTPGAKPA